jgi:hypothetical protein
MVLVPIEEFVKWVKLQKAKKNLWSV